MNSVDERIILDLCAGSGAWSRPYVDAGYDVRLYTLPEYDVRLLLASDIPLAVHGILAAPPCTALASSGARWWKTKGEKALLEALSIVDACLRIILLTKPHWWVLENPVGRLIHWMGHPISYINPCDFGDPWTKKTCLWGKFAMPSKKPVVPKQPNPIHHMSPSNQRSALRSVTPSGFAQAFFEANP